MPKPDFLCIGAQKAGTRWLYDQIASHPDAWMPPIKELHFFNRGVKRRDRRRTRRLLVPMGKDLLSGRVRYEGDVARDLAFLWRRWRQPLFDLTTPSEAERHYERYMELFEVSGDRLTGDVTPDYCTVSESQVASIARHFPGLKVILLVREPTARLWSQANMMLRAGRIDEAVLEDPERFRSRFCGSQGRGLSFLSQAYRNWSAHFDEDQFQVFFFDDVAGKPEGVLDRLAPFLELRRDGFRLAPSFNQKAGRRRFPIPTAIERVCRQHFASEYVELAELLGGHATAWLESARRGP